jgi:NCAIR mutase (PurE)-related protein
MKKRGQELVLITRMDPEKARHTEQFLKQKFEDGAGFRYFDGTGIGICGDFPEKDGVGTIVVATGGTSDIPVAEEAALTAEALGNQVERLYDVGVAGLHRLVAHMDTIMSARVIIAIAGREPWPASLAAWRTARSLQFPPALATAPHFTASQPCFPC